jgi:RIO kinase 1
MPAIHLHEGATALRDEAIEHFLDEGLIERVIRPIKSGKEASVHLCRANPRTTGEELAALKVYHPLDRRDFRDESLYRDGEWIKERRVRVALEKKTHFGRELQGALWVGREWETLRLLSTAGAPVPRPIAMTDRAILMSYVGDGARAAPQLHRLRFEDPGDAEDVLDQVLRGVERLLFRDVIHGDLSPFNVLVWEGVAWLIDFPQAVDAKKNRHAEALLARDIRRICDHFARLGVERDTERVVADLWTAWTFADLVPEEIRTTLEL